jgi:hypothetical protein
LRRRLNLLFADRVDDVLTAALEEKR